MLLQKVFSANFCLNIYLVSGNVPTFPVNTVALHWFEWTKYYNSTGKCIHSKREAECAIKWEIIIRIRLESFFLFLSFLCTYREISHGVSFTWFISFWFASHRVCARTRASVCMCVCLTAYFHYLHTANTHRWNVIELLHNSVHTRSISWLTFAVYFCIVARLMLLCSRHNTLMFSNELAWFLYSSISHGVYALAFSGLKKFIMRQRIIKIQISFSTIVFFFFSILWTVSLKVIDDYYLITGKSFNIRTLCYLVVVVFFLSFWK